MDTMTDERRRETMKEMLKEPEVHVVSKDHAELIEAARSADAEPELVTPPPIVIQGPDAPAEGERETIAFSLDGLSGIGSELPIIDDLIPGFLDGIRDRRKARAQDPTITDEYMVRLNAAQISVHEEKESWKDDRLREMAKRRCRLCFGRGISGWKTHEKGIRVSVPCKCTMKTKEEVEQWKRKYEDFCLAMLKKIHDPNDNFFFLWKAAVCSVLGAAIQIEDRSGRKAALNHPVVTNYLIARDIERLAGLPIMRESESESAPGVETVSGEGAGDSRAGNHAETSGT